MKDARGRVIGFERLNFLTAKQLKEGDGIPLEVQMISNVRGMIEKRDRGTQRVVELCVQAGHPEPQFEESAGSVTVSFFVAGYTPPHRIERDLTERQRRILHFLANGDRLAASAIKASVDATMPDRTLRAELKLMRDLGLIETSGRGPGAKWWLSRNKAE